MLHGDDTDCSLTQFPSENRSNIWFPFAHCPHGDMMILVNLLKHSTDRQFGVLMVGFHFLSIIPSPFDLIYLHLPPEKHFAVISAIHRILHFCSE